MYKWSISPRTTRLKYKWTHLCCLLTSYDLLHQKHFNTLHHKVQTLGVMQFCQIMFQQKFMTCATASSFYLLITTYKAKCAWQKKQSRYQNCLSGNHDGRSSTGGLPLKSKKKEALSRKGEKKKLSTLTFPPFPSLFVSLWTCSPWMRHKGSRGERPQDRRDCHTQIFSLETAVGATNPMSTLP